MKGFQSSVLVIVLAAGLGAQSPEPPLAETRLAVHTLLREDVFAGFLSNDMNRFARAERNAATLLEQRPGQLGNLRAWQGGMALYRAVLAHEAGQPAEFQRLYQQARDFFTEAGKATSGNDGVPAIVGGSLAIFADRLPPDQRAAAWAVVYDSYKVLWNGQAPALDKLPVHLRGEVLRIALHEHAPEQVDPRPEPPVEPRADEPAHAFAGERPHPSLVQPFTHLVEGMMPIQNGEHQGFDSTPTREAMRRMGRDEAINHGGNLQTP